MGGCTQKAGCTTKACKSVCTKTSDSLPESDELLINSITSFWFGAQHQPDWDRNSKPQGSWTNQWFSGGRQMDKLIRNKFDYLIEAVHKGILEHWVDNKEGRLALIIMCDQFSRNCYRGSSKAFKFDDFAIQISKNILRYNYVYDEYMNYEKMFILMPLMHQENREDVMRCVNEFRRLKQ